MAVEMERKLVQWRDQGLLDQETVDKIIAYETKLPQKRPLPLLMMIGLIFFSLAVFSFIAANWGAIPDLVKVSLVVLLMWIFYGISYASVKRKFGHPDIFRILGLAMFGASIVITAQTFHFPVSGTTLSWAIFIAGLLHYFKWNNTAYAVIAFIFGISILTSSLPGISWMEWAFFIAVALAWFHFSKEQLPVVFSWILLFGSGFLLWDLVDYKSSLWPIWTLFALVPLMLVASKEKARTIQPLYLLFGGAALIVYLAVRGETDMTLVDLNWTESTLLALAGLAVGALAYFRFKPLMWLSILGLTGLLLFDETAIGFAIVAELSILAYLILTQRQNKPLTPGLVYFIIIQFVIYVVYAWERLDMSLFFLIGALLLFALSGIAWWFNRRKEGVKS